MGIGKDDWKEIPIYGLIGGAFGILEVLPFILIHKLNVVEYFVKSFLVGMTIGTLCPFVFAVIYYNIRKYTFWAFFACFIFIGLGTIFGSLLMGLRDLLQFIVVVLIAELFGMSITAISYRKACNLNDKLLKVQEKLEKKVYHQSID